MPKQINMDLKTIGILVPILAAFVTVIWFFASQNSKIDNAILALDRVVTKIEDLEKQVILFQERIAGVKEFLDYTEKQQTTADEKILYSIEELKEQINE